MSPDGERAEASGFRLSEPVAEEPDVPLEVVPVDAVSGFEPFYLALPQRGRYGRPFGVGQHGAAFLAAQHEQGRDRDRAGYLRQR